MRQPTRLMLHMGGKRRGWLRELFRHYCYYDVAFGFMPEALIEEVIYYYISQIF